MRGSRPRFGAQLIAEGTAGREIIFTSRSDDRYGAGGTFDTNGDGTRRRRRAGDWGGLYVGAIGSASIDHALLTFGGGVTKIEGTFKAFNILEIHQADVRLANSVIEYNANGQGGQGPVDRFGRSFNEPATIYVRGASRSWSTTRSSTTTRWRSRSTPTRSPPSRCRTSGGRPACST